MNRSAARRLHQHLPAMVAASKPFDRTSTSQSNLYDKMRRHEAIGNWRPRADVSACRVWCRVGTGAAPQNRSLRRRFAPDGSQVRPGPESRSEPFLGVGRTAWLGYRWDRRRPHLLCETRSTHIGNRRSGHGWALPIDRGVERRPDDAGCNGGIQVGIAAGLPEFWKRQWVELSERGCRSVPLVGRPRWSRPAPGGRRNTFDNRLRRRCTSTARPRA